MSHGSSPLILATLASAVGSLCLMIHLLKQGFRKECLKSACETALLFTAIAVLTASAGGGLHDFLIELAFYVTGILMMHETSAEEGQLGLWVNLRYSSVTDGIVDTWRSRLPVI